MASEFGNFSGRYQQFSKKAEPRGRGAKVTIRKFPSFESSIYGQANRVEQQKINYPIENLISLYSDIKRYKEEFQKQFEKSLRGKLIGEQNFSAKMKELNKLISEIEQYAAEKGIVIDEKSIKITNAALEEKEAIDALLKVCEATGSNKNPNKESNKDDKDTIYLSQETSAERMHLSIKILDVISSKMRALEMLIGNKEMFKLKSLCATFQEELTNLNFLNPSEANDIIKKVEIVAENIGRESQDRRSNYFTPQQKEQLAAFFEKFSSIYAEYQSGIETNHVATTVEVIESSQELVGSACLFLKDLKTLGQALEYILRNSSEDKATLKELITQIRENAARIEENLKILGK